MFLTVIKIFACVFAIYSAAAVEVPDFLQVCSKNDPDLINCIISSVHNLKPLLREGVPDYNIPSLEPLFLKELVAAEGSGIRITAKDVKAYGSSNFFVRKLKVDLNLLRFNLDLDLPHLYVDGMYEIDGRVLLLPITGSGPMRGNFTDVTANVKFQGELVKDINGLDHLQINDFRLKIVIGQGSLQLDNLFGGDKALGDVVNGAINNNFDAFIRELQPLIEKALSDAFIEIANTIVTPFTFDQLFPN